MKTTQTSILSKKKYTFNILNSLETEIEVVENPFQLPPDELFTMAARINKKRSFLFVSKVLGKHLPINPNKGLLIAALLATRYVELVCGLDCEERETLLSRFLTNGDFGSRSFVPEQIDPVVIGFAETATALGHAFFNCFQTAEFFHTTREEISGKSPEITFEEEHSHATSHRCYIPLEMIDHQREIIFVDDEMTTGKTTLNIIRSIHEKFPRQVYTIVSILDWRSQENRENFSRLEEELRIKINVVSLLSGHVQVKQLTELENHAELYETNGLEEPTIEELDLTSFFYASPYTSTNLLTKAPFIVETGRFGLSSLENRSLHKKLSAAADYLRGKRTGNNILCLGTGEFMYLPLMLAAQMGTGVCYQSTTRSPIYIENKVGYGARYGVNFSNPEDHQVSHFVYNIPPGHYDELFIFFEREVDDNQLKSMLEGLGKTSIKSIKIVFFSRV
ncbi:phosphoribosyltransferase family protein [Neobacillus jeddahensis]|uniref:phosphoribosyltransferase family protein n=1 Tax=Neobacillus jeddahensis TaxID=1461580 RepID=UPI00058DC4BA|nr:phosphoribosyltransferase family protein [Neobacillus jeddahensis]